MSEMDVLCAGLRLDETADLIVLSKLGALAR